MSDYKDVTPRSFDLVQHKRAQNRPTDMQRAFSRARPQSEVEKLKAEIKRIENKITTLCERDAEPEIIQRWQESWQYTQTELQRKRQKLVA